MAKCLEQKPKDGSINFKSYKSVLQGLLNLFKIPNTVSPVMPSGAILATKGRPGLSPTLIASRIIKRQVEAGIPVGPLPSGKTSPTEIMWTIAMEEIVSSLTSEAVISVAMEPGTTITGSGANAGGPLQVAGIVAGIATGNANMS